MKDKSRRLTENSNWDSRRITEDGIAGEYNQGPSCAAFSRTLWMGEGTWCKVWKTRMSRSKRYYKNGFSNLYSFPRACLCPRTGVPNGPRDQSNIIVTLVIAKVTLVIAKVSYYGHSTSNSITSNIIVTLAKLLCQSNFHYQMTKACYPNE